MTDVRLGSLVMELSGDGVPVVMVHGLGGSSNSFQPLMGVLHGYRVLRPDLPGAGRSALRPGLYGLDGLVTSVQECMSIAGIRRAHFVGHSMGTVICQRLAAKVPAAVASLGLMGPILEPPPAARQALRERADRARSEGMAGIAEEISTHSLARQSRSDHPVTVAFVRESLMRQDPRGYAAHCEALSAARPADHSAIRCPTLLLAGEFDPVAPPDMARQLEQRIANSRLEVIPRVAHWMMMEAPRSTAEALRTHLDEIAL